MKWKCENCFCFVSRVHRERSVWEEIHHLDEQLFDFLLNRGDLGLQLRPFVGSHTASDDRSWDSAGSAESLLGANEDVRNVLVFAQQRQMHQNFQWLSVGCQNDKFRQAAIQSFGRLVSSASQLLVVHSLLNERHNLGGEICIREWISFRINFIGLE